MLRIRWGLKMAVRIQVEYRLSKADTALTIKTFSAPDLTTAKLKIKAMRRKGNLLEFYQFTKGSRVLHTFSARPE